MHVDFTISRYRSCRKFERVSVSVLVEGEKVAIVSPDDGVFVTLVNSRAVSKMLFQVPEKYRRKSVITVRKISTGINVLFLQMSSL